MEVINFKWEYKILFVNPGENFNDILNEAGEDGWECYAMNFTDVGTQCFCKRPKANKDSFTG